MTAGRPAARTWVAAAGLCLAGSVALSACTSGDVTTPLATVTTPATTTSPGGTATTSSGTSGSPTASPTTSASSTNPSTSSAGHRPPGLTADQQAVVTAYQDYWNVRAAAFGNAKVDLAAAAKVAEAGAILDMQRYTAQQRQKGTHTVGHSTTNVLSVAVTGSQAVIKDCFDDQSADVSNATGKAVETPLGKTEFTARLAKAGNVWRVSQVGQTGGACTVPG